LYTGGETPSARKTSHIWHLLHSLNEDLEDVEDFAFARELVANHNECGIPGFGPGTFSMDQLRSTVWPAAKRCLTSSLTVSSSCCQSCRFMFPANVEAIRPETFWAWHRCITSQSSPIPKAGCATG
jgi:hypothetical protein